MRYEMRLLDKGWAVWDTVTGTPAVVEGYWQTGLSIHDVAALTNRLNRRDLEANGPEPSSPA